MYNSWLSWELDRSKIACCIFLFIPVNPHHQMESWTTPEDKTVTTCRTCTWGWRWESFLHSLEKQWSCHLSTSGWMAERWQSGQCFCIVPPEHCPLKHMQTTSWLHAMSCPVLLCHCWATVGPSKLMQAFIRVQDNSQPPSPGYSNSVILDKTKQFPLCGSFV